MGGLKVVALISGGKDSFFSILHCIANGHDVVALANLHPPVVPDHGAVDDMDSFMYQTIGHAIIPLYEKALGLPLYRQEILGTAVDTAKSYGPRIEQHESSKDETESLVPLLTTVMQAHPEVNAVSTGAILSDYQRTRVECVALRLGLTPLSYLWRWPHLPPHTQSSLLEDMAAVGQDSRVIKVASGGLDESFLWENVAESKTIRRLTKASKRFGSGDDGAVLGEGGEFETLAISGPSPLWKGRICVEDDKRAVVHGEAGSATLSVSSAYFVQEPLPEKTTNLRLPPLLEPLFQDMLQKLQSHASEGPNASLVSDAIADETLSTEPSIDTKVGGKAILHAARTGSGANAAEQMRSIMDGLAVELDKTDVGFTAVAYTSIILRRMDDFAAVNEIYGSYFMRPNPPARVTIACGGVLPQDADVMLGLTSQDASSNTGARSGLHVQSRSYWAPANIGPYSQAVTIPSASNGSEVVYVAGQIPLVPASMELVSADSGDEFTHQAVLALQHLDRVGKATGVQSWIGAIAFVITSTADEERKAALTARAAWETYHRAHTEDDSDAEAEDFDIWDIKRGSKRSLSSMQSSAVNNLGSQTSEGSPPLWVVKVDALPRGSSIEWVGYGAKGFVSVLEIEHLYYLLHLFQGRML